MNHPLGKENLSKLIIQYSIPSIISFVVNSLYNMVDQVFIGQGVGYLGNAATNVIMPLTTIMLALGLMIGDGAAAFMSLNLGQGNKKEAKQSVGNMCVLTLIAGILLMILFELFLRPLALLFGATETVMPYALNYGRIIILGFPFYAVSIAFASIIRADGRPNETMRGLLIGCITNIILDPVFIFVFNMGVQGAAWATIIGQKAYLSRYAKEHGFRNTEFFVDDGYTGANFQRPDWQRMMSLVDEGKIGTVITKMRAWGVSCGCCNSSRLRLVVTIRGLPLR